MCGGEKYTVEEKYNCQETIQTSVGKSRRYGSSGPRQRHELAPEVQKFVHVLGPMPRRCLAALADLGLTDAEIGHYFKMPCDHVTELRIMWDISGAD